MTETLVTQEFLNKLRNILRAKNYSYNTEKVYVAWIKRYILFHNKDPQEMGEKEVKAFLTHLATIENVSTSAQNQALHALAFTYKYLLGYPLDDSIEVVRSKRAKTLPVVLTVSETQLLISRIEGTPRLVVQLIYGSGLRLFEALGIRVKDLNFEQQQIVIRNTKGTPTRATLLPISLVTSLKAHLMDVRDLHEKDLGDGYGYTYLPDSLSKKYPKACQDWIWQYIFPASCRSRDPRNRIVRRPHLDATVIQKALKKARQEVNILTNVNCHTLRHSFAAHLLQYGYDICAVQRLLGNKNAKNTMVYKRTLDRGRLDVRSPLDMW